MNQQVNNAIGGYEEKEQNGGDEPSGEAAPVGVHSREDDRQKPCPSPTYTREELVEIMCVEANKSHVMRTKTLISPNTYLDAMRASIDALIAIGAVRVK